uniref:Uncharacterized protein n=1 Tax=Callorhinchus milii TaxID=7868 RepID=A0A4W3IJX7_CALMI
MATSNMMDNITSEIICSICLDLFQDPVVLECEHYFCRSCISQFWSKMKGDTSCPECRHVSARRHLKSVRVLANIVERVRLLMPGDEEKDSLCCQEHGHGLGDRLKMYCQDDQKAICVDCWSSKHQLHRIKPIKESTCSIASRAKHWASFLTYLPVSTNTVFSQLLDRFSGGNNPFKNNNNKLVTPSMIVCGSIAVCSWLLHFTHKIHSQFALQYSLVKRFETSQRRDEVLYQMHGLLLFLHFCQLKASCLDFSLPAVTPFTFDPDTAHHNLVLSEDLMAVRCSEEGQQLPDLPGRFNVKLYVLGSRGFSSGRHYWEVSVGGKTAWVLGVCKESASRKGDFRRKPETGFWLVCLSGEQTYAALDAAGTALSLTIKPRKLGIHLDYECGCISFYDADLCCHLYTFTDSFTERLFPIFCPSNNYSGQNEEPLTLCL